VASHFPLERGGVTHHPASVSLSGRIRRNDHRDTTLQVFFPSRTRHRQRTAPRFCDALTSAVATAGGHHPASVFAGSDAVSFDHDPSRRIGPLRHHLASVSGAVFRGPEQALRHHSASVFASDRDGVVSLDSYSPRVQGHTGLQVFLAAWVAGRLSRDGDKSVPDRGGRS